MARRQAVFRMYSALLAVFALTSGAAVLVGTSCTTGAACDSLHGNGFAFAPPLILVVAGLVFDRGGVRRRPGASNALYGLGIALAAGYLAAIAVYVSVG
jgi:hypothetical protein